MEEAEKHVKKSYIPALDGLRTLAVFAVVFYHLNLPFSNGGLMGVTIFFVLSGYLITSLLIKEYDRMGSINLGAFWLRRVKRLVPAIILVILTTAALCTLFNHVLLTKLRTLVLPSLFFFNNWWQIFHEMSYFEAQGAPSPLTIFWSLSIEEQFYLIWPPLILLLLRLHLKRLTIAKIIFVLATISVLLMALLYSPDADPSRAYYGTDTRAFSLLIGAGAAFLFPASALGVKGRAQFEVLSDTQLNIASIVSFIALIACLMFMDGYSPFVYRGAMLIVSLLSAIVIISVAKDSSWLAPIFSWRPFTWLGERSYGIYLWHYPLILLIVPRNLANNIPILLILGLLALIIVVSALSYKFVENPIRKGALKYWYRRFRAGSRRLGSPIEAAKRIVRMKVAYVAPLTVISCVGLLGMAVVPATGALEEQAQLESMQSETNVIQDAKNATEGKNGEQNYEQHSEVARVYQPYSVLLIGDSVSLMAKDEFKNVFPGGQLDSAINRRIDQAISIFDYYKKYNLIGDVVVFAVGTNGIITTEQFDEAMQHVGDDVRVFWVNTSHPGDWQNSTNETIRAGVERYDNAYLIDWLTFSSSREYLFEQDFTHIKYTSAPEYVAFIKASIESNGGLPYEPTAEEIATRNEILSTMD